MPSSRSKGRQMSKGCKTMSRITAIARRIWSQFVHDPRTLALLFIAPIIVLWFLSVLLVSDSYVPTIATIDLPNDYQATLEKQDVCIVRVSEEEAEAMLADEKVDAILRIKPETTTFEIYAEGSNSTKTAALGRVVADATSEFSDTARERMQADIDAKKAEIEAKKADITQKREEIKQKIEEAQAQAESQQAVARARITDIKCKLQSLQDSFESLRSTLQALAASNPQIASALGELSNMGLGSGIDIDSIDISSSSIQDSIGSIDMDELSINTDDFNMDIDMDTYMPIQEVETSYLHGSDSWEMFDFYGPIFIALFLFIFVFITCSFSLVNERSSGTMARFLATPVKPGEVLGGYALGFGMISLVQAAIILTAGLVFMGFPNEGSVLLIIGVAISLALASVMLGLLVSGLATKAFQVIQLMLLFVVPQILLCGLFDLSASPQWLQALSRILPLTYGVDAMRQVMLRGEGLMHILPDLAVLWSFIVVFFALAALRFRKKRARKQAL